VESKSAQKSGTSKVEKNLFFFKKHLFCFFLRKPIFRVIWKGKLYSFKNNTKTPFYIFLWHHAIPLFSELHNNNLLCLLWHLKLKAKKFTPSLFPQSIVCQFTRKWKGFLSMWTANSEKSLPHNLYSFTSSLCACPARSASVECTCGLVWSNIRNGLDAEKTEKLVAWNYIDIIKLKKMPSIIYSNGSNYSSLFFHALTFFHCCSFCLIKKIYS